MSEHGADRVFGGSIPEIYDRYLVPLIFEPYAADLAVRLTGLAPRDVLEIAAGTGVVTRVLARALPAARIVATDLNQAMLDWAVARGGVGSGVTWRQADAMALPLEDETFDAVVCQFGVMFFPDRARAFSEARRVLRAGGSLLFNVWDRIEENEIAHTVTGALAELFPDDPPRFMARTPHGCHEVGAIKRDLAAGGFASTPSIEVLAARSRAPTAEAAALAYCQGTPLRNEIEAREPARLDEATRAVAAALEARCGPGPIDAKVQALVVAVQR